MVSAVIGVGKTGQPATYRHSSWTIILHDIPNELKTNQTLFCLFDFCGFFFVFFLLFLGPLPWPTEAPRLGVESEL